jgi:hypothetical protein
VLPDLAGQRRSAETRHAMQTAEEAASRRRADDYLLFYIAPSVL